jgi:DNA-binding response OmpR family regulator
MRAEATKSAHRNAGQAPQREVSRVLLVGGDEFLLHNASSHLFFGSRRAQVAGRAVKLSEALPRLKSGIDVVWLSRQFSPEELLLFATEAKQCGYRGVILQAALTSREPAIPCKVKPIRAGDFVIDVERYRVWIRGKEAQLTPQEFALLTHFSRHPRELLTHEHLLETLWGGTAAPIAPLRVLIQTLRTKVEMAAPPRYILTQHGLGYRFNPSPYPLS